LRYAEKYEIYEGANAVLFLNYGRHQRTNNVMESYNREFNNLFDSPRPGLFVFCERIRDEAARWVRLHEDALKGNFTHRQKRSEVVWPEVPSDFDEWEAPRKRSTQG
jgi:hypothetical protein